MLGEVVLLGRAVTALPLAEALDNAYRLTLIRESFTDWLPTLTIHDDDPVRPSAVPFVPYPYQVERAEAWQRGESEVNLKARQLGFSWLAAAYKLWRAAHHGWNVAYISKGQVEARGHLESRVRYMWRHLASNSSGLAPKWTADAVDFASGGSIRVFPSTPDAGVQYTFQLVVFDEFAFHQFGVANWAAILPTLSAGGQVLVMSTADPDLGPAGAFYDVWSQAEQGLNGLTSVFTPVLARPGRDKAWLERERARIGDPQRADAFYPETAAQAFVGRSGLVFPMFDKERHVRPSHPIPWAECRWRLVGGDFGGKGPNVTAGIPVGVYRDGNGQWRAHQYTELYRRGVVTAQDWAEWWHQVDKAGRVHYTVVDAGSGTTPMVATLNGLGVRAMEGGKNPEGRRQATAWLLDHDMLTIHSGCVNSVKEFANYRWTERVDPNSKERYTIATPVDNHGDAMDARGEALELLTRGILSQGEVRSLPVKYRRNRRDEAPEDPVEWLRWRLAKQAKSGVLR